MAGKVGANRRVRPWVRQMSGLEFIGKLLALGGLATAALGGLLWLLARLSVLDRLPGTIRIERPGFTCIVPLLASLLLSVVLTVVLNVVIRLLRR